jgi:antitoxin (DNA-binding transcriptional repressor) of toxin-antitoxin stability system
MTIFGHMETINISTLKAKISSSLKRVREGNTIVVLDRDIPVAEIKPYKKEPEISYRKPKTRFHIPAGRIKVKVDPLVFLMEDRHNR